MRVILKENIGNLGKKGDIVEVAPGYGRNYLLPKKFAIEVTSSNMRMIEMEQQALKRRFEQEKASYQGLIEKINETRLTLFRKTGEKDIIFGSVSSADIKDALEKVGIEIDKKKIILEEPIKRLGNYVIPIKVFHDERAEVKIEVAREKEASSQEAKEGEKEASEERPQEPKEEKEEVTDERERGDEAEKAKEEVETKGEKEKKTK